MDTSTVVKARDERGAAAVEFAIVSLVLLTLLFGMLTYGFIFGLNHDITHAATEGARAAKSAQQGTEVVVAEQRASDALSFSQVKTYGTIHAEILTGASCVATDPYSRCIHVTITYPYAAHPIVPAIFNIGVPTTMTADTMVELD